MVEGIKKHRVVPRRVAQADVAVSVAARDFRVLWPTMDPVPVTGAGGYGGGRVIAFNFGAWNDHR